MKINVIVGNAEAAFRWLRKEKGVSGHIMIHKAGQVPFSNGTKNIYSVLTGSNISLVDGGQYVL